ncbi:MAG: hypothetical protein DRP56_00785 [Planctomycetota bacterium]|nr:MAG: hypothetical protein DRP56_00785 [Planctomycetota bacterium]
MLNPTILSSYYIAGYGNRFSPLVRKTCDFIQNSMGYHSEVFAYSKAPYFFNKIQCKTKIERRFQ